MNNCTGEICILSDRERMQDLLSQEKQLIDGYAVFIPEASCPNLRQVLCENLNGCFADQFSIFSKMNQLGWYAVKDAPRADIDEAVKTSQQLRQQLN